MNRVRKLSLNLVLAIGLMLSLFFLVLIIKKFDANSFFNSVKGISQIWVLMAIAVYFGGFVLRAYRCQVILGDSPPITIFGFLQALFVGCCLNGILPYRLGEVGRVLFLKSRENLDPAVGAANLTTERLLDVFSLGLTGLFLVSLMTDQIWLKSRQEYLYLILLLCLAAIIGGKWLVNRLSRNSANLSEPKENSGFSRVVLILTRFSSGLNSLNSAGKFFTALGFSFAAIILEGLSYFILMFAMGIFVPLTTGIIMFVAIGLSSLLPAAPGSLGILQYTATFVLLQNGIPENPALNFSIVLTVMLYLPAVAGLAALLMSGSLSFREIWRNEKISQMTSEQANRGNEK